MGWRGPQTRRQFLAWTDWERAEWNEPDRHDWYAMRIAQRVEQLTEIVAKMFSKQRPNAVKVDDQRLEFKIGAADGQLETPEERAKREMEENKRVWLGMLSGVTRVEKKQ